MLSPPVISFRLLRRDDLPVLHEWLSRPHVAEWWGPVESMAAVEEEFVPRVEGGTDVKPYFALIDGSPIGYIQSYVAMDSGDGWWPDETDPGVRGIDQFLAHAEQLGQGLGTLMVRTFVRELFADPTVTRIQTDPSPHNHRAIRAYEKAGFRPVGEIDTPDGRALLMVQERPGA